MKAMNFDFLSAIAKQEKQPPRVCSNKFSGREMSPLGALIWNARKHMALTQQEFARKCGVDIDDIIKIEEDSKYNPDIRSLDYIARFLNINSNYIAEIAGYKEIRDKSFEQQIYAFAAKSGKIRDCSDISIEIFEQYLAVLHERGLHNE